MKKLSLKLDNKEFEETEIILSELHRASNRY